MYSMVMERAICSASVKSRVGLGQVDSGGLSTLLSRTGNGGAARRDAGSVRNRSGEGRDSQYPLDRRDQTPGIGAEALVPDRQRVAVGQVGQALRQVLSARHDRALCQDRDDAHVAGEGSLDLQPDDIVGIIQPPAASVIGCGQPARPDDRQHYLARIHRAEDRLGEIGAWLDRGHIDEDLVLAETTGQAVV